jgi:hypothetical protein
LQGIIKKIIKKKNGRAVNDWAAFDNKFVANNPTSQLSHQKQIVARLWCTTYYETRFK